MPFRRTIAISVPILLLLLCQTVPDTSDAAGSGIQITEVYPREETVVIENVSPRNIELKGHVLTDGEGTLTFIYGLVLGPGETLAVTKDGTIPGHLHVSRVLSHSDYVLQKKNALTLADSGDEFSVNFGDTVTDSVCWGRSSGVAGWNGPPAEILTGCYLQRKGHTDTDGAGDWISTRSGWTNSAAPDNGFEASVIPFAFPDSGGIPILSALDSAMGSIDISIYILSSPDAISILCQKAKNGVKVRVLFDGSPLGVDTSTELSLMKSLTDCGGEVRAINPGGTDSHRYLYLHNKYAVIDGGTVLMTSENWTQGNIGGEGNRGWGIVAHSIPLASYVERIFENDYSTEWGDVRRFTEIYPNAQPYSGLPSPNVPALGAGASATVIPVFSPDNSFGELRDIISGAESRVYAEQMDIGSAMVSEKEDTPIAWLSQRAHLGVDVKFILDASQTNGDSHRNFVGQLINATPIKAICVDGTEEFSLIHNKGVIADDSVWIGSVNWTANSFFRNRESALIIDSQDISEYFAGLFCRDFGINMYTVTEQGLDVSISQVSTSAGTMIMMTVNGPDDVTYEWYPGFGDVQTISRSRILIRSPAPGHYQVSVGIAGTDIFCTAEYTVEDSDESAEDLPLFACAGAAAVLGAVMFIIRRRMRPMSSRYVRHYR